VDGQPPAGRESLGGSIGPGQRSCLRPVDSVASSSGWLADASNVRLLNVLADAIPARERVVTIEDVAELRLPGPHVVRLEARPPNVEGRGEVPLRELVRNALRMRPDRIVVGEVRGPEGPRCAHPGLAVGA
jgi:Type II/IV secretion system protein